MNWRFLPLLVACLIADSAFAASPDLLPPIPPCDIIVMVTRFTIPRIDIREPATLKETLNFIYLKYRDIDTDPPRERIFVFDYRLPETTLQRHVSFAGNNVTMIQAIKLAFTDIPVAITFESGRVIFSPPSSSKAVPKSEAKP